VGVLPSDPHHWDRRRLMQPRHRSALLGTEICLALPRLLLRLSACSPCSAPSRLAFLQRLQVHKTVRVVCPADAERLVTGRKFAVGCWLPPLGLRSHVAVIDRTDDAIVADLVRKRGAYFGLDEGSVPMLNGFEPPCVCCVGGEFSWALPLR
jgi:hypothetical protein